MTNRSISLEGNEGLNSLITSEMRERVGQWSEARLSPPVCPSDIRRWAIATYWPEQPPRIYWDADYASTTRWGGIVAPPDFNPFAWPVNTPPAPTLFLAGPYGLRLVPMNGGQTDSFGEPIRPNDIIKTRSRLVELNERSTKLGLTLFFINEIEWVNQSGLFVRRRMSQGIRYIPPGAA